jgi:hypothetical protein
MLYTNEIINGNSKVGLAVRYYGYTKLIENTKSAFRSNFDRGDSNDTEDDIEIKPKFLLPSGNSLINYEGNKLSIYIHKYNSFTTDDLVHREGFIHDITISVIEVVEGVTDYPDLISKFLISSKNYYEENILEHKKKSNQVTVYIYDEWWETLSKKETRDINTIHLNGKELELLEYIKNFWKPETKKRYKKLGIPYKKNIMLEGLPGTGKTSLIFALASELKQNIAILNFNKDVDDNVFMRAIRKIPKNCFLVLEDIDVLFKERKENDSYKSSISFSALLNTLDGLAFRHKMVTFMTTNYACNLDIALKRPGRIDKCISFTFAKKEQVMHMFNKFFENKEEDFERFYCLIKSYKFTTAIIQQYFIWYMDNYEDIFKEENIQEFSKMCNKNDYKKNLNMYM